MSGPPLVQRLAGPVTGGVRATLRAWLRLDAAGADLVPDHGGVIVAANHSSHADSLALGGAIARPLLYLGDAALGRTPLLGPLLPHLGLLPVDRGSADAELMQQLAQRIRGGAALVLYPEGSRSRTGEVHKPRSGVARLAAATGAPVVPVGIDGTDRAWPVGERPRLRAPSTVRLRVGAPLPAPEDSPRARRAFQEQLHEQLVLLSGRPPADGMAPVGGAA